MYIQKYHEEIDVAVLHQLIGSHPFGPLISQAGGELVANHLPFVLDCSRSPNGTLTAHLARANSVWKSFSNTSNPIILFQGSDSKH